MGTKHGPEWPLGGCVTLGEPETLSVLWFSHKYREDNHSPSSTGMLKGEGIHVWHGYFNYSFQSVVRGFLGTLRSFQGICKITTLFIKRLRCNLPLSHSLLPSTVEFCRDHMTCAPTAGCTQKNPVLIKSYMEESCNIENNASSDYTLFCLGKI